MNIRDNKQETDNQRCFDRPMAGDYWNERFCPYFVVLDSRPDDTFVICETTMAVDAGHWTWDLSKCREVSKEYFNRVKYKSIDGFVADISASRHTWAVEEWKENGSQFTPRFYPTESVAVDFRTMMDQGV